MSSLINSQHLFRQATRDRGIIELKMQRIDVRCGALQSIATQATLVAGFAFGILQPSVLDTLWTKNDASWLQWPFTVAFVFCAAMSFASSAPAAAGAATMGRAGHSMARAHRPHRSSPICWPSQ